MKTNYRLSNSVKTLVLFLCVTFCVTLQAQTNWGPVSSTFQGSGSESDPYLITCAADLRLLSDEVENGNVYRDRFFLMTQDITFNNNVLNPDGELNVFNTANHEEWKPIGKGRFPFCGTFDGDGHSISGLYHGDMLKDSVALFGFFDGTLRNLTLKDSYLSGKNVAGFVCENLSNYTRSPRIENCHSFARILASNHGCGIYVCNNHTFDYINKCSNHGTVEGAPSAGICYSQYTALYNCINYGKIISKSTAIGIAATSKGGLCLYNCINKGQIQGAKSCALTGPSVYGQSADLCVNTGYCNGTTSYICDGGRNGIDPYDVYYHEFTADSECRVLHKDSRGRFHKITEDQTKSAEFLEMLNRERTKIKFSHDDKVNLCYWVEDEDGFPTLDYISDVLLGIDNMTSNTGKDLQVYKEGTTVTVKNVPPNRFVSVVSLTGQILATKQADKDGIVQFITLPNQNNIVLLKSGGTNIKVSLHQ